MEARALQQLLLYAQRRVAEQPQLGWLEFMNQVNAECVDQLGDGLSRFVGPEVREIHFLTMQLALRNPSPHQKQIAIRLPRILHGSLMREAEKRSTSLNCLAVAKLLQPLPAEKPEPQPCEPDESEAGRGSEQMAVERAGVYLAFYQPPKERSFSVLVQVSGEAPMLQVDWAFAVGTKQPISFDPNVLDLTFYHQVLVF